MELLLLLGAGLLIYLIFFLPEKTRKANYEKQLSADGPMKVDVKTEALGGGRQRMHIKILLSRKDWETVKTNKMANYTLFDFPHPEWPDKKAFYALGEVVRKHHVDFPNIFQLEASKEQLLTSLHKLRGMLETARKGPSSESIEI